MKNTEIIFLEISDSSDSIDKNLLRFVSNERQERIKKYRFDIDQKLSMYSELINKYKIYKELKLLDNEITFSTNQKGKPFLLNHSNFQFNISHTRNALVVAFSNEEVGIDIESIKLFDMQIANRFFTSAEQDYIISHKDQNYAFYDIWTKKEAYIKYIGTGLSTPLNSFNVLDNSINSMFHTYTINNYIVSLCMNESTSDKPKLIVTKEEDLCLIFSDQEDLKLQFTPCQDSRRK